MRYVLALLLILGTFGVCEAGCENGQCKTPVRTAILRTTKATAKVAAAPFRCRCRRCK